MKLPSTLETDVLQLLHLKVERNVSIKNFQPVSGGCINDGGRLITSHGDFFLKYNGAQKFPGMLSEEENGLQVLSNAKAIHIPECIGSGSGNEFQFLLLEYIGPTSPAKNFWTLLGEQLAALHRCTQSEFGFDHNNFIGSLPQNNKLNASWVDFFITERLGAQLGLALSSGRLNPSVAKKFEVLYKKLPSILPDEAPALLHGDLWRGNLIVDAKGEPCVIDPAVYYGNRETDLAMTQLFGGFDQTFLDAYHHHFPLQENYRERFEIYQLYPLLVHVNLFGGGYANDVISILNQYTS